MMKCFSLLIYKLIFNSCFARLCLATLIIKSEYKNTHKRRIKKIIKPYLQKNELHEDLTLLDLENRTKELELESQKQPETETKTEKTSEMSITTVLDPEILDQSRVNKDEAGKSSVTSPDSSILADEIFGPTIKEVWKEIEDNLIQTKK